MAPVVAPPAGCHGISVAERAALASQHQVVERAHVGVVPHHLGVALGLDDHRVTAPEAPPALLDVESKAKLFLTLLVAAHRRRSSFTACSTTNRSTAPGPSGTTPVRASRRSAVRAA